MAANGSRTSTRTRTSTAHPHRISAASATGINGVNGINGKGAASSGSARAAEPVVPPVVEELNLMILGATKRLDELTSEVRTIVDRLFGSDDNGQACFDEPQVTGQAYAAMQSVRLLLCTITALESEVRRLHRL